MSKTTQKSVEALKAPMVAFGRREVMIEAAAHLRVEELQNQERRLLRQEKKYWVGAIGAAVFGFGMLYTEVRDMLFGDNLLPQIPNLAKPFLAALGFLVMIGNMYQVLKVSDKLDDKSEEIRAAQGVAERSTNERKRILGDEIRIVRI